MFVAMDVSMLLGCFINDVPCLIAAKWSAEQRTVYVSNIRSLLYGMCIVHSNSAYLNVFHLNFVILPMINIKNCGSTYAYTLETDGQKIRINFKLRTILVACATHISWYRSHQTERWMSLNSKTCFQAKDLHNRMTVHCSPSGGMSVLSSGVSSTN